MSANDLKNARYALEAAKSITRRSGEYSWVDIALGWVRVHEAEKEATASSPVPSPERGE